MRASATFGPQAARKFKIFYTRMIGRWNLSEPHAALYPIVETVQPVISARGAIPDCRNGATCYFRTRRWRSVCQQAHALPFCVLRTRSGQKACVRPCGGRAAPEWRSGGICQSCTRRYTRLSKQRNLSFPHAALAASLSAGKCSPHFLPAARAPRVHAPDWGNGEAC